MKKLVFSLLLLAILLPATAQESGIRFFHGSWDEAVALAKKEKKKISSCESLRRAILC